MWKIKYSIHKVGVQFNYSTNVIKFLIEKYPLSLTDLLLKFYSYLLLVKREYWDTPFTIKKMTEPSTTSRLTPKLLIMATQQIFDL